MSRFHFRSISARLVLAISLTVAGACAILGTTAATIAAAVEEQHSATSEIARSVQQAAIGTSEVSHNVTGASHAADQSRELADNVMLASGQLSEQAAALFDRVEEFLAGLRDAA